MHARAMSSSPARATRQALHTLGATLCAAIQRRHLMVWAVFAPRFVFAAALQSVAALSSVLLWALVFSAV